jgi:hypothetical protein
MTSSSSDKRQHPRDRLKVIPRITTALPVDMLKLTASQPLSQQSQPIATPPNSQAMLLTHVLRAGIQDSFLSNM